MPTNDIMSYNEDPPGLSKCVSSLDVEGFALRMSRYLDRNADGRVDTKDRLIANDASGDGRNPFQVQSPTDHVYASSTGRPQDCPQPDVGLVPGAPVDWSPTPVSTGRPVVTLAGAKARRGRVTVSGRVGYVPRGPQPRRANGAVTDAAGDSRSPFNDIRGLSVDVTNTSVNARLSVARLWPTASATSLAAYSLIVNGRRFDSLVPTDGTEVATWDASAEALVPGFSRWDAATSTVVFRIPRRYLQRYRNVAPYWVGSSTSVQNGKRQVFVDDTAPAGQRRIGVTGRPLPRLAGGGATQPPRGTRPYTVRFTADGGNQFGPTATNLGQSLVADNRTFSMAVTSPSRVELSLGWSDPLSDLDLTAQAGAADVVYGDGGKPETIVLDRVRGPIDLEVLPTLVGPAGTTYTLTAKVTPLGRDTDRDGLTDPGDQCPRTAGRLPSGCPDRDRDGVPDRRDRCPDAAGRTANGCLPAATEWVRVLVDGGLVRAHRVDRVLGVGRFRLTAPVPRGRHTLRVVWLDRRGPLASVTRRIG